MKYLKQFKVFEAFESERLSKTLNFIKDKGDFLDKIKSLCKIYDFPESKLNDEMFEYLPFNKALKVNKVDGVSICEFESPWIKGEKCKDGTIKRTWGRGTRIVECPHCEGTGKEPEDSKDIYCLKYWFDKDGKYITLTGTDGTLESRYPADYEDPGKMTHIIGGPNNCKVGSKLIDYEDGIEVAMENAGSIYYGHLFHSEYSNRFYFISNSLYLNGDRPRGNEWNKFGQYSWVLPRSCGDLPTGEEIYNLIKSVEVTQPVVKSKDINNPYCFNFKADFRYNSINLNKREDVRNDIKEAHFAIIIFLNKIKTSTSQKSTLKLNRENSKIGATSLISNDIIKSQNLERYLNTIVNKFTPELSNVNRISKRLLGGENCIYFIITSNTFSYFQNFINNLYNILKVKSRPDDVEYYINNIKDIIRTNFKLNSKKEINIKLNKDYIKNNNPEIYNIIQELDNLSKLIYNKLFNSPVETIADMEVIYSRCQAFKSLILNDRYSLSHISRFIEHFISNDNSKNCIDYIYNAFRYNDNSPKDVIDDIKIIYEVISKL